MFTLISNPDAAEAVRTKITDPIRMISRGRQIVSVCQSGTNANVAIGYCRRTDITRYYDSNPAHGAGCLVHEQRGDVERLDSGDASDLERWLKRDA